MKPCVGVPLSKRFSSRPVRLRSNHYRLVDGTGRRRHAADALATLQACYTCAVQKGARMNPENEPAMAEPDEPKALPSADTPALPPAKTGPTARKAPGGSRTTTYIIVGCIVALLALTLLGSLMNVGDHLFRLHPILGWMFYAVLAVLVAVGIVWPLLSIAKRPIFSLYQLRDEHGHAKARHCRMLVDNLKENCDLTDEEIARLEGYLQDSENADDELIKFFDERIAPGIDDETKRAATTAFFVAAISHSPLISTVTMLSICLDLVRAIVEHCGFRPTNLGLAKLYGRVMLSALVIGGIEDADLSDMLGQLLGGGGAARAGGFVLGSATDGLVSAFLVFRVGVITKRWLTSEDGPAQMRTLRRTSYKEALRLMRDSDFASTVGETMKQVGFSMGDAVKQAGSNAVREAKEAGSNAAHSVTDKVASAARHTVEKTKGIFSRG